MIGGNISFSKRRIFQSGAFLKQTLSLLVLKSFPFSFYILFNILQMVRRRPIQNKKRSSSTAKRISCSRRTKRSRQLVLTPLVKPTPTEHLDDETKLAKRHLTKEMWQLVSIAVKRMADELVSISTNQQTVARTGSQDQQTTFNDANHVSGQSTTTIIPSPNIVNTGAGDEVLLKDKSVMINEPIKRRMSPLQILEPSSQTKRKGSSNNATRRTVKSKIPSKSSKKKGKITLQRTHSHSKSK